MKLILLVLILVPSLAFCQVRNDTKIIVVATDTSNLFNRAALSLIDLGYSFEQKDRDLNFIRTTEKALKKHSASAKINVIIKDSTLTISGLLRSDLKFLANDNTFSPVQFRDNNKNINMDVWIEMLNLAISFGNKISYAK